MYRYCVKQCCQSGGLKDEMEADKCELVVQRTCHSTAEPWLLLALLLATGSREEKTHLWKLLIMRRRELLHQNNLHLFLWLPQSRMSRARALCSVLELIVIMHVSRFVSIGSRSTFISDSWHWLVSCWQWQLQLHTSLRLIYGLLYAIGQTIYIFILSFVMATLRSRCRHYIFAVWFLSSIYLLSFFISRLISAAADWMSTILRHMVWP